MVKETTLSNGLRIITDEMNDVETVSMGIWVSVGSRFEEATINGISHLLEHMAFKGTTSRSALQIAQEVENVGGVMNAYTSKDVTAYYVKVLKEDASMALSILADIFQNSTMDKDELAREKGVVLQEISQTADAPDDIIFDYFQETAFPDQPMGRPILGSAQTVQSITSETLLSYMHGEYSAPRTVISAAGRISHDFLVNEVEKLFTKLPAKGHRDMLPARYVGGEFRQKKDIEQVNILLGFPGLAYQDDLFYAQTILSTLLGGGMSSRLFQEVREKRGLVYTIYSFATSYTDSGLFGIYAGTGEKEVKDLLPVVCDELLKVGSTLTEAEIERAKAQLKAMVLMKRESTSARCEGNARNMAIWGRVIPKEETIAKIESVNADALRQTAHRLFSQKPTLASLGPVDHVWDYNHVMERLSLS